MRCRKAGELISLYLAPAGRLSEKERGDLEAHLAACEECRRDCEEAAQGIALFRKYWHISPDTQALIDRAKQREAAGLPIDPLWRFRRLIEIGVPASVVAACLTVLVLGWWVVSNGSRRTSPCADSIVASQAETPLSIASANGTAITPGSVVETQAEQIDRLTLNGKHTLVMNGQTRLSIGPLAEAGQSGCLVNLTLGEIHVHVEHDGRPFAVQTPHGRAVITGTTFDVKATDAATTLVVAEGSVRFESEGGAVLAAGGYKSIIAAPSRPPGEPVACDAAALTAWAKAGAGAAEGASYGFADDLGLEYLPLPVSSDTRTDLKGIKYGA